MITRRSALALSAASLLAPALGLSPAAAAEGDMHDVGKLMAPKGFTDRPLGSADAKVTVIEYASPTCPHCAAFHQKTYGAFRTEYVDTGKVRFILRPFMRHIFDAVVFMLADAAGEANWHKIVDTYFNTFDIWTGSDKPRDAMLDIAKQLGFTEESFDAALTNQALFTGMEELREQAISEFDLTGTPTFYISGKQMSGDLTLEELAAAIDPLLA